MDQPREPPVVKVAPRVLVDEPDGVADPDAPRMHPATARALELLPSGFPRVAAAVRAGAASPYSLSEDDVHIPPGAIKGRVPSGDEATPPPPGSHFTACVRASDGRLRVDHTGSPAFWLEIDLRELMDSHLAMKYRPDGEAAQGLAQRFDGFKHE